MRGILQSTGYWCQTLGEQNGNDNCADISMESCSSSLQIPLEEQTQR